MKIQSLKDLIKVNKPTSTSPKSREDVSEDIMTYHQKGFGDSVGAHGNQDILRAGLESLYQRFEDDCRSDQILQDQLKGTDKELLEKRNAELKGLDTKLEIAEEEQQRLQKEVVALDNEIADVKSNPEKYGLDVSKKPRAQFYIGLVILALVTIYTLVFYISASYSAFFRQIAVDTDIIPTIFDPQAFNKALADGWLEAVFVGTIPFAFMGLGYLIHMFQKSENRFKYFQIFTLVVVTFIFDVILAYQIEKKIYDVEKSLTTPDFDFSIALIYPSFWGIIFAGFVVYLIWGLIFDFIMKEYDELDKIKLFITSKKKAKKLREKEISDGREEINAILEKKSSIQAEIARITGRLDQFVFPIQYYLARETEYFKGWLMAISKEIALPTSEKKELIEKCILSELQHREAHNLITKNSNYELQAV